MENAPSPNDRPAAEPHVVPEGAPAAPLSAASLAPFPAPIQRAIVGSVCSAMPSRATDIWYQDKTTGDVHVMRAGMQWHLNSTASAVWQLLDGRSAVEAIAAELKARYPDQSPDEVAGAVVEFLLNAHSSGLVDLYPEPVAG
jgi:hypothetical protein